MVKSRRYCREVAGKEAAHVVLNARHGVVNMDVANATEMLRGAAAHGSGLRRRCTSRLRVTLIDVEDPAEGLRLR